MVSSGAQGGPSERHKFVCAVFLFLAQIVKICSQLLHWTVGAYITLSCYYKLYIFSLKELRESRSAAAGSPGSMMKLVEDYKATEFISIFQKFKLAFNLLVGKPVQTIYIFVT